MLEDPSSLLEKLASDFDALSSEFHEASSAREADCVVVEGGERWKEGRLCHDLRSTERIVPHEVDIQARLELTKK